MRGYCRAMSRKHLLAAALLPVAMLALAQVPAVKPILPESLRWTSPPTIPGLKGTWILGSEREPGIYVQRVVLAKGARIPTHTHPDTRYSTILTGTLYVAFGAKPADADFVAVPEGGVYVAPAVQVHTLWARDGEVVYQEAGNGPTGTNMVN
jgi:quercetin dioxygenase-like cupin family protein